MIDRREQDRRVLSDRLARERRQQVTEFLGENRRQQDRRAAERRAIDNARVSHWMARFDDLRNAA